MTKDQMGSSMINLIMETACLSKVHINREPSGQVRIAMMVINEHHIKEVYDIRIGELESELQQAMSNNDKYL
jgi:hypothetical protein